MILGRTPAGLIKTKSDGALGLRAVNCACCGVIPCAAARVSAALKVILENSNTVTVSGGHSAAWDGSYVFIYSTPPDYLNWSIQYIDDLIYVSVFWDGSPSAPPIEAILISEPLTLEDCGGEEDFSIFTTITIQGKSYRAMSFFGDEDPIPLTVTFS